MKSLKIVIVFSGLLFAIPNAFSKVKACDHEPTGTETSDYLLPFITVNMPDPAFDGLPAHIRVHRVKPVYSHGKCNGVPNLAAVLVHGRTADSAPSFDVRLPEGDPAERKFSTQDALARAGIDTFAPDLLGYGYSSRSFDLEDQPNGLDDPCNASFPACPKNPNGSCTPTAGVCDCSLNPIAVPINQQALLRPNPLDGITCPHSSSIHFANHDVWARDIIQVIDDAIEKAQPRGNKVILVGYSLGGVRVARTLYLLGSEAEHKVRRVVLWSSLFNISPNNPNLEDNPPTEEDQLPEFPSFPLALTPLSAGLPDVSPARQGMCGSIDPDLHTAFRQVTRAQEDPESELALEFGLNPMGIEWGGSDPENPTGFSRTPTFTSYGWNPEVAATFTLPTLVMNGLDDTVVPKKNSNNMFDALTSVTNKLLVQVDCGGHSMQSQGCNGNVTDAPFCAANTWSGPYSTVNAALIEWIKYGSFQHSECGHFMVDTSGVAKEVPTANCPAP